MGIGPGGSSLLHKLGRKAAWEMSETELQNLIAEEQQRRTIQRAIGRIKPLGEKKPSKRRKPEVSLEQLGIAPELIKRLRDSGQDESKLIEKLRKAGLA